MSEEEIEVQQEPVEAVETEAVEQEVETEAEPVVEAKPKSGFIDYDLIADEQVRETVRMRNNADFRKIKEGERKQAEYDKKIKEYEEKLAEINKPREVSPPTPDDFLDDPDKAQQQLDSYSDYMQKQRDWDVQQQIKEQQVQEQNARQMAERQQSFLKKVESAGISESELGYAASVAAPILGNDIQSYLMEHDFGPQILMQLAKNPMELQEVASLNPYQVGVKLDSIAKAFKPTRVTKAPPPDEPIQGSGVDAREQYPALKGSTIS